MLSSVVVHVVDGQKSRLDDVATTWTLTLPAVLLNDLRLQLGVHALLVGTSLDGVVAIVLAL